MPDHGSVTHWIHQLKQGDSLAARRLWERYFPRLVSLARDHLRGTRRRAEDEEDAAQSAFASFCRRAREGRLPDLSDENGLWRLLIVVTARKAADQAVREGRLKRGGGRVRGDSALVNANAADAGGGWEEVVGTEPTPELAAQVAEEVRRLLALLPDDEARDIAVWKMEDRTNEEIAERLGRSVPTVERRLRLIRRTWEGEVGPAAPAPA
jgi:RNA polymerase sigma factor (sigma-70 family)